MTVKGEIYKCDECGSVVEVLVAGAAPVCCGKAMHTVRENTSDGAKEKHVPVICRYGNGTKVTVGSVMHPSTQEHYIMWIELITENGFCRRELVPGDLPEAYFEIPYSDSLKAREYCNLHGLWRK